MHLSIKLLLLVEPVPKHEDIVRLHRVQVHDLIVWASRKRQVAGCYHGHHLAQIPDEVRRTPVHSTVNVGHIVLFLCFREHFDHYAGLHLLALDNAQHSRLLLHRRDDFCFRVLRLVILLLRDKVRVV